MDELVNITIAVWKTVYSGRYSIASRRIIDGVSPKQEILAHVSDSVEERLNLLTFNIFDNSGWNNFHPTTEKQNTASPVRNSGNVIFRWVYRKIMIQCVKEIS